MSFSKTAALVAALTAAGAALPAAAAGIAPSVGQHATVMNNIYRAQQRNSSAINRVQSNIRSAQQRRY